MTSMEELGNLGDFLGGIAVIVTLIYLTIQIRKQTNEVRLTATRELSGNLINILNTLAHDRDLADIYYRGLRDYDSVQGPDRMRLNMLLHAVFRVYEQSFLHTGHVGVDGTYFVSSELTKEDLLGYPGVQRWWQGSGNLFEPTFAAHVERVIDRHRANENPDFSTRAATSPVD